MAERKEEKGCRDSGIFYPHGSEFCKDIYCFKCIDGEFEMYPWIGARTDLLEVW